MERTKENGKWNKLRRTIMCGILSCVLALGAVLTMPGMGMTAKAADGSENVGGIIYYFRENLGEAYVYGFDKSTIGPEIHIPAKIKRPSDNREFSVTTIVGKSLQFARASKITLEEGIQQIGGSAFSDNNITEIEIPASVYWIRSKAFDYCKNLTKVRFKGTTPPTTFDSDWLGSAASNNITIELPNNADKTAWESALGKLTSNGSIKIEYYTPSSSSSSSSSPNQENNSNGEVEFIEEEPINRIPEHVCQYEWEVVREVSADQDGLEQYLCKLCGNVQSTLTVPASHYQVQELYTKVTGAGEGETVTYDLGMVHTVCDKLFTKLQQRKDITLVITYQYKGESYRTTFPAGADYTELIQDTDQFYGMLGLNGRCGIVTEKN